MPEFDYQKRLEKTKQLMQINRIDILFLTNLQNIYWLSGTAQYGNMFVFKDREPALFIRRNFERAIKESHLNNIFELKKTSDLRDYLNKENLIKDTTIIGTELSVLPVSYFNYFNKAFDGRIKKDIGNLMQEARMVKDEAEIEIIREANKIAQKTQEIIPKILKVGIMENEIAAEMIKISKLNAAEHYCIYHSWFANNWFIVSSGSNLWIPSTFPVLAGGGFSNAIPFGPTTREIQSGDMIVADYAMIYNGYHADHARTYLVDKIPDKFKERAELLFSAYVSSIDLLQPGNTVGQVFNRAKSELAKYGLEKNFEGDGKYYQGYGHGLGLELDEPPFFIEPKGKDSLVLETGMVISLEPKIIFPGWGAIQFEDNFVIRDGKPEILTKTPYIFDLKI